LLGAEDEAPRGAAAVGDVGPLRCFELDPSSDVGAQALAQLGYQVRFGVSVRFAGTPSVDREGAIPTFVAGDQRVLVPQRLSDEAALTFELNGRSSAARYSEVVRVVVEAGDQLLRVSNDTESREYAFCGVG